MTPKTLKALKGSIEKWEKIVDCEEADDHQRNCELCQMFYRYCCDGCPIYKKSGKVGCRNTPHSEWCKYTRIYNDDNYRVFDQKSQNLAIAELEFLKSLLPAGEQKC